MPRRPVFRISLTAAITCIVISVLGCKRGAKSAAPKAAGARLRIITLTPSFSEIVFALGRGGEIVGVDQYSDFPPEASQLPRMGSFLTPNVEAITAAAPDVVLLDAVQSDARRALESVGVHAVAPEDDGLAEFLDSLARLSHLPGD